jgi:hypothetical protein
MQRTHYHADGYAFTIDEESEVIRVRQKSAVIEFTFGDFSNFAEHFIDFLISDDLIAFRKKMVIDPTTWPPAKEIKSEAAQTNNSPMDAIVRAAISVDAHWREFGPEHGFGEIMDRLYAVLQQQHQ